MSTKPPSRVVFVGNIPYGLSEEQITDLFSSAGKVLNFRLVYDRETGRPKGFGFAEYPDADSAASAVRNLNDHEIMGRKLRVDYSTEGRVDPEDGPSQYNMNAGNTSGGHTQPANGYTAAAPAGGPAGQLPPLPPGKELPPGVTCTDAISRTLNTLPPSQLLDILSSMKSMATTDPQRATELLAQAPQLSYAIFQALLLMGLVSPDAIHSVVDPSSAPPAAYQAPAPVGYPPNVVATPPVGGAPYAPPPQTATPQQPYAAPAPTVDAAALQQDPDALMRAVMELPQATIDQLPEAERQQILALRASFMTQRR